MISDIQLEIEYNLQVLEKNGLKNRKIVIFGAGKYSYELYKIVENYGYSVFSIIDNNKALVNHKMEKNKICHTSQFLEKYDDKYIFLIVSGYYNEMKEQLEKYGYSEYIHIFNMAKIEKTDMWHLLNDTRMEEYTANMKEGRKLHKWLLKKYGSHVKIMINSSTSIGDVYIMGFYIKEYLKSHKDCLFLYGSLKTKRLADELGFEKTLYLSFEKIQMLLLYARVCGYDKVNVELLHTDWGSQFCIWGRMLYYAKFIWMEHCRELFGLPENIKPNIQHIHTESNIDEIFKTYKLLKKRTVILSPEAQSLPLLSDEFWCLLTKALISKGYCVCTNIGSDKENAITGTIPLLIKINDIYELVEQAGFFIGLRSGLCDLLCDSDCKKIVLYSNEGAYNVFSLKLMGFDKNLSEYIVKKENEQNVLKQIVQELSVSS